MRLGAVSPEMERGLIEGWKAEWRILPLTELYELRKELIRILEEARIKDEQKPGMIPGYAYMPAMRVRAMDELIREKTMPERTGEITCPQCSSTLKVIPPSPELLVTQAFVRHSCPVCGYPNIYEAPTGGWKIEMIEEPPPGVPEELLDITDFLIPGGCGICPECGERLTGHSLNGGTTEAVFNRTQTLKCPVCGVEIARAPEGWELTKCPYYPPPVYYWPAFKEMLKKYWPYITIGGGIGTATITILLLRKKRGE